MLIYRTPPKPAVSRPIVAAGLPATGSKRGFATLSFPFNRDVNEWIKQFPGVHFDKKTKQWIAPREIVPHLGLPVRALRLDSKPAILDSKTAATLRSYQRDPVATMVAERSWLLSFETGLGKSPCLLLASGQYENAGHLPSMLIACPANVLRQWEDYVRQFLPHRADDIVLVDSSAAALAVVARRSDGPAPVVLTTHKLLSVGIADAIASKWRTLDVIAIDESQAIKNPKAAVTKTALEIAQRHPRSARFCLTATPISNECLDLHSQLDFLWPGRFGTTWMFERRYFQWEEDQYAVKRGVYAGVSARFVDELQSRLSAVSTRLSKTDPTVAADLPKLQITTIRQVIDRAPLASFFDGEDDRRKRHDAQDRLTHEAARASGSRVSTACDLARSDGSPVKLIVVYHRSVARAIAKNLERSGAVALITGEDTPEKRRSKALALLDSGSGTLVATMKAIAEGVDWLKTVPFVLVAELYWNIRTLEQLIGRFQRIGGTSTLLTFLILENTVDGAIMSTLRRKLSDARSVLPESAGQQELSTIVEEDISDDDWATLIEGAAASAEHDEYSF